MGIETCNVSDFTHIPVLLKEVQEAMCLRGGGQWADGTSGGGGHSEAILEATAPGGFLWACDQDGDAIEATKRRLDRFAGRFELKRMNFEGLKGWLGARKLDGVLLDLGTSSHQLDTPDRGFSFQADGPLDMRMDTRSGPRAADIVNGWGQDELANAFYQLGDEPDSRRIARAIVEQRRGQPFETTSQLADCVERVCPRRGRKSHPATRVFQALRMVVNREREVLVAGLKAAWSVLGSGGRLAVITFHSGEDRMVKDFMREEARDYDLPVGQPDVPELRIPRQPRARLVTRRPVLPTEEELDRNPRARSAQLRVAEKLEN
jgi:16S rRNA (cytosine1402-N4)-methyltransferase